MTTRRSVPTKGMCRYWNAGWSYVMPDFDVKDHSIIEWIGTGEPQEPSEEADKLGFLADLMGHNK